MYVLILVIIVNFTRAPAMTNIHGFKSMEACQAAAATWTKQVESSRGSVEHFAVCARQD